MLKDDTFLSRQNASRDAKLKLLSSFKNAAEDPGAQQRKAERAAIVEAREARLRAKAEIQARKDAEARRIADEIAAERRRVEEEELARKEAAEAQRRASQPKPVTINAAALALARLYTDGVARKSGGASRTDQDQSRKSA